MKNLLPLLAIVIVCSGDGGLTRTVFENANRVFYAQGCLVFEADRLKGPVAACGEKIECVVTEGEAVPPGTPSDDYLEQQSTETKKQ